MTITHLNKKSSILFLGIFLTFLNLSFFHSHKINIELNSPLAYGNEQQYIIDPFLDSSFNCTIQTFSNSIIVFYSFEFSNTNLIITDETPSYYNFFNSNHLLHCSHLRAPPFS